MHPLLTYSLLALCGVVVVVGLAVDRASVRTRFPAIKWVAPAAPVIALVAAYLVLRPGRGDDARARIVESTSHHAPILLDVYSNY